MEGVTLILVLFCAKDINRDLWVVRVAANFFTLNIEKRITNNCCFCKRCADDFLLASEYVFK